MDAPITGCLFPLSHRLALLFIFSPFPPSYFRYLMFMDETIRYIATDRSLNAARSEFIQRPSRSPSSSKDKIVASSEVSLTLLNADEDAKGNSFRIPGTENSSTMLEMIGVSSTSTFSSGEDGGILRGSRDAIKSSLRRVRIGLG